MRHIKVSSLFSHEKAVQTCFFYCFKSYDLCHKTLQNNSIVKITWLIDLAIIMRVFFLIFFYRKFQNFHKTHNISKWHWIHFNCLLDFMTIEWKWSWKKRLWLFQGMWKKIIEFVVWTPDPSRVSLVAEFHLNLL